MITNAGNSTTTVALMMSTKTNDDSASKVFPTVSDKFSYSRLCPKKLQTLMWFPFVEAAANVYQKWNEM